MKNKRLSFFSNFKIFQIVAKTCLNAEFKPYALYYIDKYINIFFSVAKWTSFFMANTALNGSGSNHK